MLSSLATYSLDDQEGKMDLWNKYEFSSMIKINFTRHLLSGIKNLDIVALQKVKYQLRYNN